MNIFQNLRIGTRLGIAFGILLLLIVAVAAIGIVSAGKLFDESKTIYEDRTVPLGQLGEINHLLQRNRVLVLEMLFNPQDPQTVARRDAELRANLLTMDENWRAYMSTRHAAEEVRLADALARVRQTYAQQGLLPMAEAVKAGDLGKAENLYQEQIQALAPQVQEAVKKLVQLQIDVGAEEFRKAEALDRTVEAFMLASAVLALLLGAGLAWSITRSITRPIDAALQVANAVAAGDLRSRIATGGQDQIAELLRALQATNDSLVQVVGEVRQGSESVACASAQIAQGNQDLSQRTEEQASALQETAASMEQLGSTVAQNAEHARQANQLAQSASQVAGDGGQVVAQVVPGTDTPVVVSVGGERRSPNRATNVSRPVFGGGAKGQAASGSAASRSASASSSAARPAATAPQAQATAVRTGTDDWTSF